MKKIILFIILILGILTNVNAKETNKQLFNENKIFNTLSLNVPATIFYYDTPIYRADVRTSELWLKDYIDLNVKNDTLQIDIKNRTVKNELFESNPDKIIIRIYSPKIPKLEVSDKNLCVTSRRNNKNKKDTQNEKN